ncbi:NEW3 domain-containing protein, partial [Chloroflexota bacterium]
MKKVRVIAGFCLLLVSLMVIFQSAAVLAQDGEWPESIEMTATYPASEGVAGSSYEFEITLGYRGDPYGESKSFELNLTVPESWNAWINPQYDSENRIREITLEPSGAQTSKIEIHATAPSYPLPEPGEYPITLEVTSGDLQNTIELTAVITAVYDLRLVPSEELYNTSAIAGRDNFFSIEVVNLGSDDISNVTFSSTKPSGWTIEFTPDKIDSVPALDYQTVDVNIIPAAKAIAGDYSITIRTSNDQTAEEPLEIRVTVETPTIWGWVGIGIIVLVIAGIAYIFMRFGRR